jgi:hypothetical protein
VKAKRKPEDKFQRLTGSVPQNKRTALARTLYALADGRLMNVRFGVHGLRDFDSAHNRAFLAGAQENERCAIKWLPDMDLNHDKQIQSLLCYRYTIGQTRGFKVTTSGPESRLAKPGVARSTRTRRPSEAARPSRLALARFNRFNASRH